MGTITLSLTDALVMFRTFYGNGVMHRALVKFFTFLTKLKKNPQLFGIFPTRATVEMGDNLKYSFKLHVACLSGSIISYHVSLILPMP